MTNEGNLLAPVCSSDDSWSTWSPMPSLSPSFFREEMPGASKRQCLGISGNGNLYCFGAWCQRVSVEPGQTYRLRVVLRAEGLKDPGLHLTPHVVWRRGERPEEQCAEDTIRGFRLQGDRLVGEDLFVAPDNCDSAEVRLLLRYAPEVTLRFEEIFLTAAEMPGPRRVRVGTMRCCPPRPSTADDHLRIYAEKIDRLGATRPDLILLPEFANTAALPPARGEELRETAETIPGPFCRMLAEKAAAYGCYICAGILERDGDYMFNAALLYDRKGEQVGKQRKVHPYWPEEPMGISPGDSFQTIQTDFGTVGIMICYDSWWPESARLLALQGAELILFPNAGYEEKILPARAIDNNAYLVVASLGSPAAIVDPRGEMLAISAVDNVLTAEIDLNDRPKCHPNAGGNLNPGPGGARWARNARSIQVYEEILAEVQRSVEPETN